MQNCESEKYFSVENTDAKLSKRIERKLLGTFSPILNTKHPQLKPLDHLLTVFLLSAFLPQFATIHFKGKHQLAKL